MKGYLQKILDEAGITINGNKPYDIHIHHPRVYIDVFLKQSIGAGEAYMNGLWDCEKLDELFYLVCRHKLYNKLRSNAWLSLINAKNTLINQQTPQKSLEVANQHYNLGNKMYEKMLGESMAYTCGYWKEADNLDAAQFAKYELTCKKMGLKPGDTVLEIGCGWGGLAKFMAEKYGCYVVAIDIAREPVKYATELCRDLPVNVYQCDYRDVSVYNPHNQLFDKIVSVGVLEHVGYKNYKVLMQLALKYLSDNGIFLLHSIGGNISKKSCEPWINKYIFPHGMIPSLKQLGDAFEQQCVIEDHHNFGAFYDKTLMAWHHNLNTHWPELKSQHDERFLRMMNYYLLSCAGGFRARDLQLWQFVLTKKGLLKGYQSIR